MWKIFGLVKYKICNISHDDVCLLLYFFFYFLILPLGEASEKGDRTKESEPDLGELLR